MRNATLCDVLHEQNKSHKKTLRSTQNGLETVFKHDMTIALVLDSRNLFTCRSSHMFPAICGCVWWVKVCLKPFNALLEEGNMLWSWVEQKVSCWRPPGIEGKKENKKSTPCLGNMEGKNGEENVCRGRREGAKRQRTMKSSFIHTICSNYQCICSIC